MHLRHGELAPGIIVDRMKREFKVDANGGKPQVAYRETIRGKVESEGKFVRQSGGRGQYGHVWLKLEPNEQGKGYEFINGIVGGSVPREYVPAVDKGIKEAVETGVIAGYPIVDVKVTLFDGSYHDVDSNEMAFKIAGSMGFKEGFRRAKPVLLEPIMKVEVVTPRSIPAMSSATSTAAAGRSPAWPRRRPARRSPPTCRCRRCSAMPRPCAP